MGSLRSFRFVVERAGTRLDKSVSEKCPEFSRSYLQKLIAEGHITVNGRTTKAGYKLSTGDRIIVNIPPPLPSRLSPEAIPLKLVYEDDDLLVVDKPAGLTTHPAPGHPEHTLVNALLSHYPRLAEMGATLRPGIVHRLDRDTSGLIIVAKNTRAQLNLIEQFRSRSVAKAYLVLVKGRLTPERGAIEAPLGRDSADRKRMAVVTAGREARTDYRVIRHIDGYTLLEAKPQTGRTHQIRVHFAAIGYPVVGDPVYGVKSPYLKRQFLHAHRLAFRLPSTGQPVELQSELPEDLERAVREIEEP
ncbi:MAG: RluA family pseudouridine synthase [Chloroflexi bacterium]|nr:RluA family pseudouridine synthase [Chloroflexota bacterium]